MEINGKSITDFAKRAHHAWGLVNGGKVYQVLGTKKPNWYGVLSTQQDGTPNGLWMVRPSNKMYISEPFATVDEWECPCPDWENRQDDHMGNCKHVLAVRLYRDLNPPQVQVTEETVLFPNQRENDIRKTCLAKFTNQDGVESICYLTTGHTHGHWANFPNQKDYPPIEDPAAILYGDGKEKAENG